MTDHQAADLIGWTTLAVLAVLILGRRARHSRAEAGDVS